MTNWWPTATHPLWTALTDAGLTVTNDPRRVSPPCVLMLPTGTERTGNCSVEVTWTVTAVAPGPEHADALSWLWNTAAPELSRHLETLTITAWQDFPALQGDIVYIEEA